MQIPMVIKKDVNVFVISSISIGLKIRAIAKTEIGIIQPLLAPKAKTHNCMNVSNKTPLIIAKMSLILSAFLYFKIYPVDNNKINAGGVKI